ncbi:amidohydrolase family protein [Actinosynnema sp. NPDC091369]
MSDRPSGRAQVLVRGQRIVAVGEHLTGCAEADVVELGDRTLLPGFIDCHVHVVPQLPPDNSVSSQTLAALPALRALLDNGFTTVRDLGCTDQPITVDPRRAQRDGVVEGPRLVVAPHIISGRGGHGDKSAGLPDRFGVEVGVLADGVDEVVRAVRTESRLGADWIKYAGAGGFGSPVDDPELVGYSQQEVDALVATARDLRRPCAARRSVSPTHSRTTPAVVARRVAVSDRSPESAGEVMVYSSQSRATRCSSPTSRARTLRARRRDVAAATGVRRRTARLTTALLEPPPSTPG